MCDNDAGFAAASAAAGRYQPLYIESYLEHRTGGQTIEEWTQQEGQHLFSTSDIYRPLTISVAIQGHSNNCFAVDMSKADWHSQLTSAVKSTLVAAELAQSSDNVSLTTVRGDAIADSTMHGLRQLGVVYPLVNGKKPAVPSPVEATHIATPATHAINREELLAMWTADVCEKCIPVIAQQAAQATSARDLDERLFGEQTKALVRAVVEKHGGHLPSFQKVVEVHADPALLVAIDEKKLSRDVISSEIADHVLRNVEGAYQAHVSDVTAYFKAQELKSAKNLPSGKRTIFGSASAAAAIGEELAVAAAIEDAYPTAMKLHKTILSKALMGNNGLEQNIGFCIRVGPRRRNRRHQHGHAHKHAHDGTHHHHVDKSGPGETAAESAAATENMTPEQRAFRNLLLSQEAGASVTIGEKLFGDDEPERLMQTMRRRHELARLPPSPGVVSLDGQGLEEIGAKAKGGGGGKVRHRGHLDPQHAHYSNTTVTMRQRGNAHSGGGAGQGSGSRGDGVWDRLAIRGVIEPPSVEFFESAPVAASYGDDDVPELELASPLAAAVTVKALNNDEPPALEKVGAHLSAGAHLHAGGARAHAHLHAGKGHHAGHHHHAGAGASAGVSIGASVPLVTASAAPALPSLAFLNAKNGILYDGGRK